MKRFLWLSNLFLAVYALGCWRSGRPPLWDAVLACFLCGVLFTIAAAFLRPGRTST